MDGGGGARGLEFEQWLLDNHFGQMGYTKNPNKYKIDLVQTGWPSIEAKREDAPRPYRLPDGSLKETREIPGGRGISLFQACQNMMLAARAHGVSSLFTSFFFLKRQEIKEILGIPPRIFMECAIFLGYAEEKLGSPRRLPVPQVTHRNTWGTPYVLEDAGS